MEVPAGAFRVLDWPGTEPAAVFLHGLTAVADVWAPTIEALPPSRPRCIAIDQRGHGRSPQGNIDYRIGAFVRDLEQLIDELALGPVHLVGHSMGARVAMVAAARRQLRYLTPTIVDIGPEQWRGNWVSSVEAFSSMPAGFDSEEEAVAFASHSRPLSKAARAIFLARLEPHKDRLVWRADTEALKTIVTAQRSRNYWAEWDRLDASTLLVRAERSNELRTSVTNTMRQRNPSVAFRQIPAAPHNIPLAAPEALAKLVSAHWATSRKATASPKRSTAPRFDVFH